jgi:hypothetical protein
MIGADLDSGDARERHACLRRAKAATSGVIKSEPASNESKLWDANLVLPEGLSEAGKRKVSGPMAPLVTRQSPRRDSATLQKPLEALCTSEGEMLACRITWRSKSVRKGCLKASLPQSRATPSTIPPSERHATGNRI